LRTPFRLFRGERQGEAKIGAGEGTPLRLPARDSQKGKKLSTEISEYLLAILETLESLFPETLVTPLIIKRAPVSVAEHMVGLGHQLEPLLGADVAGIAVRMVTESELTEATLDIGEGRRLGDAKNFVIIAVCLHFRSRAGGNPKGPPPGRGARYPLPLIEKL